MHIVAHVVAHVVAHIAHSRATSVGRRRRSFTYVEAAGFQCYRRLRAFIHRLDGFSSTTIPPLRSISRIIVVYDCFHGAADFNVIIVVPGLRPSIGVRDVATIR